VNIPAIIAIPIRAVFVVGIILFGIGYMAVAAGRAFCGAIVET
jgi:hypothetical protein